MNVLVVAGPDLLPFVYVLVRRPILRRLALRNAVRRPREALLVVLGSLLGAAIITGSAVVGDTMNSSIRQVARQHLGPIDELVVARNVTQWRALSSRLRSLPPAQVDGVLPLATGLQPPRRRLHVPVRRFVAFRTRGSSRWTSNRLWTSAVNRLHRHPRGPAPEPGHAAVTTRPRTRPWHRARRQPPRLCVWTAADVDRRSDPSPHRDRRLRDRQSAGGAQRSRFLHACLPRCSPRAWREARHRRGWSRVPIAAGSKAALRQVPTSRPPSSTRPAACIRKSC